MEVGGCEVWRAEAAAAAARSSTSRAATTRSTTLLGSTQEPSKGSANDGNDGSVTVCVTIEEQRNQRDELVVVPLWRRDRQMARQGPVGGGVPGDDERE